MIGWQGEHLVADLGDARALFTSRTLDLRDAADHERLQMLTGLPIARCSQVHGREVLRLTGPPDGSRPEADGVATNVPRVAALVLTADCLPVALHAAGAVAMVHAGWRGLAAGVLDEGLEALRELGGTGPVTAAIGPGAGVCCYEVGDEVREAFADVPEARDGRNIDLPAVARRRLVDAGVAEIHEAGICTMCDERFFSHRRDRGATGRQGGAAWLA
jgi:YfiH family protein